MKTPLALTTTRRRFLAGTAALLAASRLGRVALAAEHPVYLAERAAVRALVPDALTTHTAVKDGPWEAATFGGTLPGDGSRVLIPMGRSVTLGGTTARIKTLHVTGSLAMKPEASSKLIVDTAVIGFCDGGGACGAFISHPQASVTHTILFADMGPIDLVTDPGQFGRGLVCHGRFDVAGAAVSPWVDPVTDPPESMLARNVIFTSESAEIARRGHVMLMHTSDVTLNFARFSKLGRTNKGLVIHNTTNPRGRYALHFHRCGFETAIQVEGCVADDSPGWGFVNHSSNVDFHDCIGLGALGAQFVGEAGNEMGSFEHCLAARGKAGAIATKGRQAAQDFGFQGFGIFCQGPLIVTKNCTAIGQRNFGIWYECLGLVEAGLGECLIDTHYIPDYLTLTNNVVKTALKADRVPLAGVHDNTVIDSLGGFAVGRPNPVGSELIRSYVNGVKTVNCETGIDFQFQIAGTYTGVELKGNGKGRGINHQVSYGQNCVLKDFKISGYPVAFRIPISNKTTLINGKFEGNGTDLHFHRNQSVNQRIVTITNCGDFTYKLGPCMMPLHVSQVAPYSYFSFEQITIDGQQLYYKEQAAAFVPFPTGTMFPCPTEFLDKTNRQLLDTYGLCILGAIAPADSVVDKTGDGLLGAPAAPSPDMTDPLLLRSPLRAPVGPYTLRYHRAGKDVTDPTAATLHAGWNAVTRGIGGVKRTFFVWGL